MSAIVWTSNQISILIQFITGIVGVYGLTIPLAPTDVILREVLTLEMIVQVIEFIFYIGFLTVFHLASLTQARYYDWFLSTPIMLFTTSLYFYFKNFVESKEALSSEDGKPFSLWEFAKQHRKPLLGIFVLNFLMLLFGFLAELGLLPRGLAFVLGTGALCGSFLIIYENFARFSKLTNNVFFVMFTLWAMYGVFFLLPPVVKNVGYTTLDIFAKNFFGLFLTYVIYSKRTLTGI
jgi:bacteriorhodopsin